MRVNLEPNGEVFTKQVKQLRRTLDSQHLTGGQSAVSARFLTTSYLPFLTALRTELRDEVVPAQVMHGAANLIANMALTVVQTLVEAPGDVEGKMVEELLLNACGAACAAIKADHDRRRPVLSVVPPAEGDTIIHMNGRRK